MASQRPVFTLLAGDICYADPGGSGLPADDTARVGGVTTPGTNLYNPYVWDVFLNQIEGQAAFAPWMFATGNHDMEPLYGNTDLLGDSPTHGYGGHADRLDLPKNGPQDLPVGVPVRLRQRRGHLGRRQRAVQRDPDQQGLLRRRPARVAGGDAEAVADRRGRRADDRLRRRVLPPLRLLHDEQPRVRRRAARRARPAVLEYQVDLVVQGHNHLLERTDPIKYGQPTRTAPDGSVDQPGQVDGVTYMCVGAAGGRATRSAGARAPTPRRPPGSPERRAGPARGAALPRLPATRRREHSENNTENVVNSYYWSADGTAKNSSGYPQGTKVPEVVDAGRRCATTTTRSSPSTCPGAGTEADDLHDPHARRRAARRTSRTREIDRITLRRIAGSGSIPRG